MQFLPLLEMLEANKHKLLDLLTTGSEKGNSTCACHYPKNQRRSP